MSAEKFAVPPSTNVATLATRVHSNPTQDEFRALALAHTPNMVKTGRGSMNKVASIAKARSAANTFVISDDPSKHTAKTISSADAAKYIEAQEAYISTRELIRVDGYIGNHPETRVRATLWMTIEGANVAAMQQILYFPSDPAERANWVPEFQIIYTPGLKAEGMDKNRLILVDVDQYVTRVMGSDYFGESKKGGLRMLNAKVFRDGGLVLHAGAKLTPVRGSDGKAQRKLILVMGESGTGKTTSTFSPQGDEHVGFSESIQDDMVMLFPGGRAYATENGCFAIAHGLREDSEPIIYRGAVAPNAWLENVYQNPAGEMDFHKGALTSAEVKPLHDALARSGVTADELTRYESGEATYAWTKNSRVIIPMSDIETAGDSLDLPAVSAIGVLNRNTNVIPGVVRFRNPAQAAAYFMLGETMGTAASGADAGKAKRSPFTNPFFPLRNEQMANRYMELAKTMPQVFNFMMNTGWVGGDENDEKAGRALKVKIRHSSAILQALADGTIEWVEDPDFGYEVAKAVPGVPEEILRPKTLYAAQGRQSEYDEWVRRLREERRAYLEGFPGIDPAIIQAV
ncbi:MAG: phosphoenolpyruvate carboxykinase domain-containing protein [Candidatus Eiseniibacteriota bacterium]